ncbi:MAG: hypothetical protein ACOX8C_18810, partial [Saccharomonospora viridis]|uniref:hypothetical protein n=1 Tax=Saccharomonospora viridis TaxID=1852 RepID=UPI003D8C6C26
MGIGTIVPGARMINCVGKTGCDRRVDGDLVGPCGPGSTRRGRLPDRFVERRAQDVSLTGTAASTGDSGWGFGRDSLR